jgi:hypothetical protein
MSQVTTEGGQLHKLPCVEVQEVVVRGQRNGKPWRHEGSRIEVESLLRPVAFAVTASEEMRLVPRNPGALASIADMVNTGKIGVDIQITAVNAVVPELTRLQFGLCFETPDEAEEFAVAISKVAQVARNALTDMGGNCPPSPETVPTDMGYEGRGPTRA